MSVPWSASNPRMKYWSDLPPPACCETIRPGTWRRMSETWVRERYLRSSRERWTDDADSAGAVSLISMISESSVGAAATSSFVVVLAGEGDVAGWEVAPEPLPAPLSG